MSLSMVTTIQKAYALFCYWKARNILRGAFNQTHLFKTWISSAYVVKLHTIFGIKQLSESLKVTKNPQISGKESFIKKFKIKI